jgi:DNA-binding transcriptional ArsR family regulator/uncharacterized protein YndB with AHSA1/START domain
MDEVFKALNDPGRRRLLDALFARDGQTLGELCAHLPRMTRYGVMSHLRVLEAAGLVTTRRAGRTKHHYLNPVPIRLAHDRWISKYTEPVVGALARVKTRLEQGGEMNLPDHVYLAFIDCTVEDAWHAIVNGDKTALYYYGTRVESEWRPGAPIRYLGADGGVVADGEIIAIDEPKKLEITFHARWDPQIEAEGPVRMVWTLASQNGLTTVTVELHGAPAGTRTYDDFVGGLPFIVSGMKTLLETGAPIGSR